jgi:hypothetical protein
VALVAAILQRIAPERALAGVVFLAWNPLVLHEVIGNGHNDITMIFWVLLSVWWLLNRRHAMVILALVAGALFKYVPMLMLPAAGLIALRDLVTPADRRRFLITAIVGASALIGLAYMPFWYGVATLNLDLRAILFSASLPAAVRIGLQPSLSAEAATQVVNWLAGALTVSFVLWQAIRARQDRSALSFARFSLYVLLFGLMFTTPWFQHWYAIWLLPLAALLPPDRSVRLTGIFSIAAWAKFFIITPVLLWVLHVPSTDSLQLWYGPLIMALPWAYAGYALWRSRDTVRTAMK